MAHGLQDSLSTLHLSCSAESNSNSATTARLDTERMANPSPTGTFTLQDTPDFAWRETVWQLTRQPGFFRVGGVQLSGYAQSFALGGLRYFAM